MSTTPTAPKCPFKLPITAQLLDGFWWWVEPDGTRISTANTRLLTEAQAHWMRDAINSHATLTAEVARLREALNDAASFLERCDEGESCDFGSFAATIRDFLRGDA